jgi:APA family basic amino acid/polyamine antiporter
VDPKILNGWFTRNIFPQEKYFWYNITITLKLMRKHSPAYRLTTLEADNARQLKRTLTWFDIAVLGVSMSVGAGIFSIGAKVITEQAGPAAVISFFIAAFVCTLAAMSYAEFATVLPIAGSAYTFSYAALGEIIAWSIGWNVILELFMACTVVIKYWSIYLHTALDFIGVHLPDAISVGGFRIDWTIFIGIAIFTIILVLGTDISAKFARIFVVIKIGVILFVIISGLRYFNANNLSPFIMPSVEHATTNANVMRQSLVSFLLGHPPTSFGVFGIFAGAALVFFAFIGFDNAAAAAEETINPRRNMPIGLMVGIGVVSVLYILVSITTVGMVSNAEFQDYIAAHPDVDVSIATAFEIRGEQWAGVAVSFGAFIGLTTVIVIAMLGLSRIIFAMSRDGLLPRWFSVTGKRKTPYRTQIGTAILIAAIAAFFQVETLAEMINIGTLSAFIIVSASIPIIRKKSPLLVPSTQNPKQSFRVPLSPFLPIATAVICVLLALNLAVETWIFFAVWVIVGLIIYASYGYRNSQLHKFPDRCD